jgi:beta-lactamase class A
MAQLARSPFRLFLATLLALLAGACASVPAPAPIARPAPPPRLAAGIESLARGFDGKVGIAVEDVQRGWVVAHDGDAFYPQQSVGKLWVAMTLFDAADAGRIRLSEPMLVRRQDMSVFNQPIQEVLGEAGYRTTLDGLLGWAISKSDNAADDILLRRVGGPRAVEHTLKAHQLEGVRAGPELSILESRIAGIKWKPEYSFGEGFYQARDKVDPKRRAALLDAYVADPADGVTPKGVVDALSRLQRGELLSDASTSRFLDLMAKATTGPMRLKAGLGPGWTIAHKTGTGQDLGDLTTGFNDVGLITAPDGATYAVAVMIAATRRPIPERQALMAEVVRAVVALHDTADR